MEKQTGQVVSSLTFSRLMAILRESHTGNPRYAYNEQSGPLCVWLMMYSDKSADGNLISEMVAITRQELASLLPRLQRALGLHESNRERVPTRRHLGPAESAEEHSEPLDIFVNRLSRVLIPDLIAKAITMESINTLMVVPIKRVGVVPFSLLKISGRPLVESISAFVPPEFNAFMHHGPEEQASQFTHPIIIGNPVGPSDPDWTFPSLPGAEAEARAVAQMLNTHPLVGSEGRYRSLLDSLKEHSDVKLVYLATHDVADSANPLESSFVLFADGLISARVLSKLPLQPSRPLVVLSACQTGLGKDFDAGTIGLARAFQVVGASNVVMSFWCSVPRQSRGRPCSPVCSGRQCLSNKESANED